MKKTLVILFMVALALPMFAQAGKYGHGQDSIECVKYLSYYREYVKQNNLAEAVSPWKSAISICPPEASQNMLIDGQKILRYELNSVKDATRRAELIDSLLMLADLRATVYPSSAVTALNNKAVDMINYKWKANDNQALYDEYTKIISTAKSKGTPVAYVKYMESTANLYKESKLDAETVMKVYEQIASYMEESLAAKADGQMAGAKQDVETLLADCGVASCDNLIGLFTPRYESNPSDKDALSTIVKLLGASECADSDLYLKSVESLHSMEPTASTAYYLYKLYAAHDQNHEAVNTLIEAIEKSEDNVQASDYSLELGTFYYKKMGQMANASAAAKKAIELDERNAGRAYLLLGTIWGSMKCSGNELESRAPFWVAVDYMTKAKNADETLAEEANKLSAQYRQYFPQQADAFMYDVVDGQSYTVSCNGMREATTVRTLK